MYYHGDGLWSVKAITVGVPISVANAYAYDAWGNQLTNTESMQQPYGYVGQLCYYAHYQDSSFHLLQLGVRYYDPGIGQFLSRDPVGYEDGHNVYTYAHNNPSNMLDSSGMSAVNIYPGLPGLGPDHPTFAPMPQCIVEELCPRPSPIKDYYFCLAECGLNFAPIPIDVRFPRGRPNNNSMLNPDYWKKCKITLPWKGTPGPKAMRKFLRRLPYGVGAAFAIPCVYR